MREPDTVETHLSTVIVVVGGPPELVQAVQLAADSLPRATVDTCSIKNAATTIATVWPFAIVLSEDVYLFDSSEFEALARDVTARLVRVSPDGLALRALVQKVREPLLAALRDRLD